MSEMEREQPWRPNPLHGQFSIKKIYIKDISFETPNSPQIFQVSWEPVMDVHLHSHSSKLDAGEYEVVLMVTAVVTVGDKTAFLAETAVAGIFGITGLTSDELGPTLGSYCPGILFPYAREFISSLVTRGGFPPFILAPVNFEKLYQEHISAQFSEQQAKVES
jgi:preprotein translocase subunit SecB